MKPGSIFGYVLIVLSVLPSNSIAHPTDVPDLPRAVTSDLKRGQACAIALMYASSLSRNISELFAFVSIFPICRLNVEGAR